MSTPKPTRNPDPAQPSELLQLLSVLGFPQTKAALAEKARALHLTDPSGQAWQAKGVGVALAKSREQEWVICAHDAFECTPGFALLAFKTAVLSGRVAHWHIPLLKMLRALDEHRRLLPLFNWEPRLKTVVRIAAFGGNEELLQQMLQVRWGGHPLNLGYCLHGYVDAELLSTFEPHVVEELATDMLAFGLEAPNLTTASLFNWAQQRAAAGPVSPMLGALLVHQLIWRMRFEEAAALTGSNNEALATLVRAHASAMQGAYLESLPQFEAAAAAVPLDAGGKRMPLPPFSAWLRVAAMVASDVPAQLEAAAKLCRKGTKDAGHWFWNSLQVVIAARMDHTTPTAWFTISGESLLDDLTQAIAYAWLQKSPDSRGRQAIERWEQLCASAGYLWAVRELRACLTIWDKQQPGPSLAGVFQQGTSWQRALKAIATLQSTSQSAPAPETRLVWLLRIGEGGVVTGIEPCEQRRTRSSWKRGKRLGLDALLRNEDLQPADARVVRAIRAFGSTVYELDVHRATRALLGHPLVFLDEDLTTPAELTAAEPELLITELEAAGEQLTRLTLQPDAKDILAAFRRATFSRDGKESGDPCLVFRQAVHSAQVVMLNATHRRLAQLIGDGLEVPAAGAEDLQAALAGVAQLCVVHVAAASGREAPTADGKLRAELSPQGRGLQLHLVVRPFGSVGPRYVPGRGNERVFARIDGQPRAVLRDLDAERAATAEIIAALESFAIDVDTLTVDCEEPGTCLELLERLQSMAALIQIEWPAGVKYRLSRPYAAADLKVSLGRRNDWFAVDGGLQLDDGTVLELRHLLDAARRGHGRFVPLGEDGFVALSDNLARRLHELALLDDAKSGAAQLPLAAALALADLADGMQLQASVPWQQAMQRIGEALALQPEPPSTLQAQLRPYQLEGYRWLARLAHWGGGACLADDMGLGKTLQALAVLLSRAPGGPALVVAPTSVCQNWLDEARRFAPALRVQWFVGPERTALLEAVGPFDVLVCSYTLLQQEIERFAPKPWHSVVLDEAQAVKNVATKRAQAVLALQADFRVAVTGTPVENRLEELWMVFRFLNPGLLGPRERFNERFAGPIERANDASVRAHLRRLIAPFMLRRTKSEVLTELPPRTEITLSVEPEAEEAAFHEALRQNALQALADPDVPAHQKRFKVLAELMRVRRACCHPQLIAPDLEVGSAKLEAFLELVTELVANRHKALVFSQFVDHLSLLRARLDAAGIRYQYLDGATPATERVQRVQAFQGGEGDLFLISLRAGGVGLNLTAADYVIITDPWWNPAVEDQAASRAHRMGQERPVTVYRLVVKGSIEERIMQLHAEKRALAEGLFTGEEFGGAWSAQDLMELLRGG